MIFGYKEDEDTHGFFSLEYTHEPDANTIEVKNHFNCVFDSPKNGKKIIIPINEAWDILSDLSSNFNIPEKGLYTLFFKDIEEKFVIKTYIHTSINEYEKEATAILAKANQVIDSHTAFSTLKATMVSRKTLAEKQLENVNAIRILLGNDGYGL